MGAPAVPGTEALARGAIVTMLRSGGDRRWLLAKIQRQLADVHPFVPEIDFAAVMASFGELRVVAEREERLFLTLERRLVDGPSATAKKSA